MVRTYSSSKEGYRLDIPASWEEKSKSGECWHACRHGFGCCCFQHVQLADAWAAMGFQRCAWMQLQVRMCSLWSRRARLLT